MPSAFLLKPQFAESFSSCYMAVTLTVNLLRRAGSFQTVGSLSPNSLSILADTSIRLLAEIRVAAQGRGVLGDTVDGTARDLGVERGEHRWIDRDGRARCLGGAQACQAEGG